MYASRRLRPRRVTAALVAGVLFCACGCDEPTLVWLPDSSGFLYTDKGGTRLVRYDVAKQARRVVVEDSKAPCLRPAVSPDGKHFAVAREVWASAAGSRETTVKLQIAIYDADGREVRRSREYEYTVSLPEAATESSSRTQAGEVVWGGHSDRLLTRRAIYDRMKDKWLNFPAVPAVFQLPLCHPTEKGFLAYALTEKGEKESELRVSFMDWDGWASEFKEPLKWPDTFSGQVLGAAWDGDVWRLTTTAGVYHFDTKSLKHEYKPAPDGTLSVLEKAAHIHRFAGTDVYLCAFTRSEKPEEFSRVLSKLELHVPSKKQRKVVYAEGEYDSIRLFPSPDGKKVAAWCNHPGENQVFDVAKEKFVPRVPPLPPKNVIVVFDDAGEVVASVKPE